ncbi:MAG: glycosyltransferase [Bacteroidetes bacterium]|nr:glycosyltransferase [Bacteroidota bacterium]MCB9817847.1 glycosyltransferase [Candidatus Nomurabacteria bacterium]
MNVIKVLHVTTHDEDCGIAKYQQNYIDSFTKNYPEIENQIFEYSPNKTKTMNEAQFNEALGLFKQQIANYDILHIQHEFGFFQHNELEQYVKFAKKMHKKVIFTVHTSPDVVIIIPKLGGIGPRSIYKYLRERRHANELIKRHVIPLRLADIVLAHNELTIKSLLEFGVAKDKVIRIKHPIPNLISRLSSDEIKSKLDYHEGDIIFACVGFMHKHKGLFDAVKALNYLPHTYKLAIIGGVHPFSDSADIYNKITDLIVQYNLQDRVYITGFIKEDNRLNSLIQEAIVCVYPYDGVYYGKTSSGALNLAFANSMPVIAYPTATIREIAEDSKGAAVLTDTFSYYELARKLLTTNFEEKRQQSVKYAKIMSWNMQTSKLTKIYKSIID